MVAAMWGAVLISLVVVSTVKIFDLNSKELKALKHIQMSRSAAKCIKTSL